MYRKEFEVIVLFKFMFSPLLRPRRQPRVDEFELAHKQAAHSSTRSPDFGAARVNMQNMMEFNQLKYRGKNTWLLIRFPMKISCVRFPGDLCASNAPSHCSTMSFACKFISFIKPKGNKQP